MRNTPNDVLTQATLQRPIPVAVSPNQIPADLQCTHQWVCWMYQHRPTRSPSTPWAKVPLDPRTGYTAKSNDRRTWGTFKQAMRRYQQGGVDGIGFVLTGQDRFVGLDLDGCRDTTSGKIAGWARSVVERIASYSEVTPSAGGLRILLKGKLPARGRKKGAIELYESGRYLTITGYHLAGSPETIEARQAALDRLHQDIFTKERYHGTLIIADITGPILTDEEIITRALSAQSGEKFARLWTGNLSGYASHSEGDLALCGLLARWTGEAAQIDRIFRRSGLYRPKWDHRHYSDGRTYGQATIAAALTRTQDGNHGGTLAPVRHDAGGISTPPRHDPWLGPRDQRHGVPIAVRFVGVAGHHG